MGTPLPSWRITSCNTSMHIGVYDARRSATRQAQYCASTCRYTTDKQFACMPRAMCTALGDVEGRRPHAVLLVVRAGT